MVFITNEKKARRIFGTYANVAAFTLGETRGISENGLEISYEKLSFLPDDDVINAVLAGDIKPGKVIKKAVSALYAPEKDDQGICIPMAQMINIIAPEKRNNLNRKGGPNIIVFVLDDDLEGQAAKRAKFLVRYLTALFEAFGIEPVTDGGTIKDIFDIPDKKVIAKMKAKKVKKNKREKLLPKFRKHMVIRKLIKFIEKHDGTQLNKHGHILRNILYTFFKLELYQSGMNHIDMSKVGKANRENMAKCLADVYTNDNLKSICALGIKDGLSKKYCKKLKKKNKRAVESYNIMAEIMQSIDPKLELPKVKSGYKKNKKKSKEGKRKMKVKKFVEFYSKKKNLPITAMIFAHTTCRNFGVEVGSTEYNKHMSKVTQYVGDGYGKLYSSAAKAWAKEATATAEAK